MYHSGTHPAHHTHHFLHIHMPHFFTRHVTVFLLTLALLALLGVLIYMANTRMPTNIEFRPIYFPGPLVFK